MKKILLITAAFGGDQRELIIKSSFSYKDYSFYSVFYNDRNTPSRINSLHPRLKSKIPKMMAWFEHPGYDYYIWVDSLFTIENGFVENMMQFIDEDVDLFLFAHTKRNSIKNELNHINLLMNQGNKYLIDRYDGELINEQVESYLADETFVDHKLFAGGCFMYSKKLVENKDYNLMTDWLLHNTIYSIQDQLSLPYLLHKHQTKYIVYPHVLMKNSFLVHDWSIFF